MLWKTSPWGRDHHHSEALGRVAASSARSGANDGDPKRCCRRVPRANARSLKENGYEKKETILIRKKERKGKKEIVRNNKTQKETVKKS